MNEEILEPIDFNQGNLCQTLCDHFSYLCSDVQWEAVLKAIFTTAISAGYENDNLVVVFSENQKLIATPGCEPENMNEWPEAFCSITKVHEALQFPDDNWGLFLGESFNFEPFDLIGEAGSYEEEGYSLLCPLTDYSDWWIYHPETKTKEGKSVLTLVSHESCDFSTISTYSPEQLFLKRLIKELGITVELPEAAAIAAQEENPVAKWWNNLDEPWKAFLTNKFNLSKEQIPTQRKVDSISDLTIRKVHGIRNLEPLLYFPNLTDLGLKDKEIDDISIISKITKLESLTLWNQTMDSVTVLSDLPQLRELVLNMPMLNDFTTFFHLHHLEQLTIHKSKVPSIDFVASMKALRWLDFCADSITSLEPLYELEELHYLSLQRTEITEEELEKFRTIRPGCTIDYFKK